MTTPMPVPLTEINAPFCSFRDAASVMAPRDIPALEAGKGPIHKKPMVYILEHIVRFDNAEQFLRGGDHTDLSKGASFPRQYESGAISIVSAVSDNEIWKTEVEFIEAFAAKMGYKPLSDEEQRAHYGVVLRQPSRVDNRMSRSMTMVYPLPKSPVVNDTKGARWQLARTETMNLVGSSDISISAVRLPQTGHSV